jgi:hypothetical protein
VLQRQHAILVMLVEPLVTAAGARASAATPDEARLLGRAIGIHVHSHPDSRQRARDALDAVRRAKAYRLRAIVLKNHDDPTTRLASIRADHRPRH